MVAEILDQAHQGDAMVSGKLFGKPQVDQIDRCVQPDDRGNDPVRTIVKNLQNRRHFLAATIEQWVALDRLAMKVVRQVGVTYESAVRSIAGTGEYHCLLAAGVAAVDGDAPWVEQIKQGINHGCVDFGAVTARRNLDDMADQLKHEMGWQILDEFGGL